MDEIFGTTITMKTEYGTSEIHVNKDDMNIDDVFEELIEPLLLAVGYSKQTIDVCTIGNIK